MLSCSSESSFAFGGLLLGVSGRTISESISELANRSAEIKKIIITFPVRLEVKFNGYHVDKHVELYDFFFASLEIYHTQMEYSFWVG